MDRFVVLLMSRGRVLHNLGPTNIKTRSPEVLNDLREEFEEEYCQEYCENYNTKGT